MALKVKSPLVTVDWLSKHIDEKNLILFDATIPKVTSTSARTSSPKKIIKNALFFDLKGLFSNPESKFPNTVPTPESFQENVRELGVHQDSCIVVYDDLGIYSAPRVRWLFNYMGFTNIAVLDGGLKAWLSHNKPTQINYSQPDTLGDFTANRQPEKLKFTEDVLEASNTKNVCVIDARSEGRFLGIEPEPRQDLAGGCIPSSKNLPFSEVLSNGFFKEEKELMTYFNSLNANNQPMIFTCGSGITACILALAAELIGKQNYSVYDGSWTEWASTPHLPIAK